MQLLRCPNNTNVMCSIHFVRVNASSFSVPGIGISSLLVPDTSDHHTNTVCRASLPREFVRLTPWSARMVRLEVSSENISVPFQLVSLRRYSTRPSARKAQLLTSKCGSFFVFSIDPSPNPVVTRKPRFSEHLNDIYAGRSRSNTYCSCLDLFSVTAWAYDGAVDLHTCTLRLIKKHKSKINRFSTPAPAVF